MKFYLNGALERCDDDDANATLLGYLRSRNGGKGTKEGCGSGDCGACTVLVAGVDGGDVRAVNSCISLLGSISDRQVITVEGLAAGGKPHPVQRAMVDCHASQCGFCTPGFVMSLSGLYQRRLEGGEGAPDRESITDCIAGNLCRCTGYRPIVDAGRRMMDYPPRAILGSLATQSGAEVDDRQPILASGGRYYMPASEASLRAILDAEPGATLVAGGTDLVLEITQRYRQYEALVDLSAVAELQGIATDDDYLSIGAGVRYRDLLHHPLLDSPALDGLLKRLGSEQVRNRGTLGGNLANGSPIADTPPALLVWDAEVEIVRPGGARDWCPVADFYLDYRRTRLGAGDYLARVRIPLAALRAPHRFYKLSKRFEDDISSVMCAVSLELDGASVAAVRIAYGGMAAVPRRATAAEDVLRGVELSDEAIALACAAASAEFQPLSDVRASAAYRLAMAAALLQRGLLALRDSDAPGVFDARAEETHA